ncbi:MAG: phosphoadenylyl-sulfate reductase [Deltaproteobacteria bacterium]|nr:phosphoadenylyl-sulfate reductase [Deltaproteobacteria bacterium]
MSEHPQDLPIERLNGLSAEELLRTAIAHYGQRLAIGTSFQHGGLAVVQMALAIDRSVRVFTIDTGRLHQETIDHVAAVEQHFGIAVERYRPDPIIVERMVKQHGPFLFFDSVAKRQYCCAIRKDAPNRAALANTDCWITGLRRTTPDLAQAEYVVRDGRRFLRIAPVIDWSTERVEAFIAQHGIPVNPLYAAGYRSIGCQICTTPVRPHEAPRAGRWRWEQAGESKECGLHFQHGDGI